MARMKILNASEQEAFDAPPRFNSVERKQFFDHAQGSCDARFLMDVSLLARPTSPKNI